MIANDPRLRLDAGLLDEVIEGQTANISELVRWRLTLRRGAEQRPERRTIGHELLAELLREKQGLATERLFRALGLRYPEEDLAQIYQGLRSEATRASGLELLHGVLPKGLREDVLALVAGEDHFGYAGGVSSSRRGPRLRSAGRLPGARRQHRRALPGVLSRRRARLRNDGRDAEESPAEHWEWLADLRHRSLDLLSFRPGSARESRR